MREAATIALGTIRKWLDKPGNADKVDRIVFCTFLAREQEAYDKITPFFFPIETSASKPSAKEGEKKETKPLTSSGVTETEEKKEEVKSDETPKEETKPLTSSGVIEEKPLEQEKVEETKPLTSSGVTETEEKPEEVKSDETPKEETSN